MPKVARDDDRIDLSDLRLVLRQVAFEEPLDGRPFLFFSDTEVTNRMFAVFLADTDRWRDDTETERFIEPKPISGNSMTWTFSTSDPLIRIEDKSSLWRNGNFPKGRGDHPVTLVTIEQATGFCRWLDDRYDLDGSFRLPTEAEWLAAAYGKARKYPWGDDEREWTWESTEPVRSRPDLKTPHGLFGMWGNVSELVLSPSTGYGGTTDNPYDPWITTWLGTSYEDEDVVGELAHARQDYWGYTHSVESRSDVWGFRVVFLPDDVESGR